MFGYVTPYKSELKIREYNIFRAHYCGLCKTMGREHNQLVRMGLNYDLSFLSILLSSLEREKDNINLEKCISHPIRKRMVIEQNKSLKYTSSISIILIYFKLLDDWNDDRSFKALIANIPFNIAIKKAKGENRDKFYCIKEHLSKLSQLEKDNCSEIDQVADVFGKIMEEISSPEFVRDEKSKRILKCLGYYLGRWIYITDAFDDIKDDIEKRAYNPLLLQFKYQGGEDIDLFIEKTRKSIELSLTFTLENISKSFELLDILKNREILENIIYLGMRNKMEMVLNKKGEKKIDKSI